MPTIGNEVWIGVNATIVGKVLIGDDVLIALMHLLIVIYLLIVWSLVIHAFESVAFFLMVLVGTLAEMENELDGDY